MVPWVCLCWGCKTRISCSECGWIQDQIDFEQRRSRGVPVPQVADDPSSDNSEGDDGNLYSDQATMMTEEARTLILAGDTQAGLEAYKKRMYRKMQANAPEEVSSSAQCGPCELGQLFYASGVLFRVA